MFSVAEFYLSAERGKEAQDDPKGHKKLSRTDSNCMLQKFFFHCLSLLVYNHFFVSN